MLNKFTAFMFKPVSSCVDWVFFFCAILMFPSVGWLGMLLFIGIASFFTSYVEHKRFGWEVTTDKEL